MGNLLELQEGKNPFSEGTFPCNDYPGCLYQEDGRCIFNVARLQIRPGRACYDDLVRDEREAYLDYMDGRL